MNFNSLNPKLPVADNEFSAMELKSFEEFDLYDFNADLIFQQGLRSIDLNEVRLEDAKGFYYKRYWIIYY